MVRRGSPALGIHPLVGESAIPRTNLRVAQSAKSETQWTRLDGFVATLAKSVRSSSSRE